MTTNHHTPIANGALANASTFNGPLSELDSDLDAIIFTPSGVAAEFLNGNRQFAVPSGTGSTNGHTIQEEGASLTQRANLNFVGPAVSATDQVSATQIKVDASNFGTDLRTLSATLTLADTDNPVQICNPNGANRIVRLPAAGANNHKFIIVNSSPATYTIDVQTSAGVSLAVLDNSIAREFVPDKAANYYFLFPVATQSYTFALSIASNNLTIALKLFDGADPSANRPLNVTVGSKILQISAALSVTITAAMGDVFLWDPAKIQDQDAQLFVYLINNNGAPQLGAAMIPSLATVATNYYDAVGQTGAAGQRNIIMSGTRNATNSCSVIGRINVSQTDANNWQNPVVSGIVNYPIYNTDWLKYVPFYTAGFSVANTGVWYYKLDSGSCKLLAPDGRTGITSSTSGFSFSLPVLGVGPGATVPANVFDNGAFVSAAGWMRIVPAARNGGRFYKTTYAVDGFTASGLKDGFGQIEYPTD